MRQYEMLIFELAAYTRPHVPIMQRSRPLSCSNVHGVQPCTSYFAPRAASWCSLGLLGRRAWILCSPSHFSSPREHSKRRESFVTIHTIALPKKSSIGVQSLTFFVRGVVCAISSDRRARVSSSCSGLYSRPQPVYPLRTHAPSLVCSQTPPQSLKHPSTTIPAPTSESEVFLETGIRSKRGSRQVDGTTGANRAWAVFSPTGAAPSRTR